MFGLRAHTAAAALLLGAVAPAAAASGAALQVGRGCYLVGEPVLLNGSGFTPNREFDLTDDGVDFGQSQTDAQGAFAVRFRPGGLPAGVAQHDELLEASDGTQSARASFTLTEPAGARFLASHGKVGSLRAPYEVWDFSPDGRARTVYLHYVSPAGRVRQTLRLGTTRGACGYLRTGSRSLFPFHPSPGLWTLQVDTQRAYRVHPSGAVARIRARVA